MSSRPTEPLEPALEPELPIVDPHHHLWDRSPLLAEMPPPTFAWQKTLQRSPRYLLDELLADVYGGHDIRSTVYLECRSFYRADGPPELRCVGETEFVNGMAAVGASGLYGEARICAGIVGHADLTLGPAVPRVLEAHLEAGGGRFRGIRQRASYDPDPDVLGELNAPAPGLYTSDSFLAGFEWLGKLELSFDAWVVEPQLPEVAALAQRFPDTPIVLNHAGTPLGRASYAGRLEERFPIWRDSLRQLAERPNVTLKLGGLGMDFSNFPSFATDPPASSEQLARDWRPYLETGIETFGPERCMFESNYPMEKSAGEYGVIWNAFKRVAAGASAAEKAALFSGTASRVYRVPV